MDDFYIFMFSIFDDNFETQKKSQYLDDFYIFIFSIFDDSFKAQKIVNHSKIKKKVIILSSIN